MISVNGLTIEFSGTPLFNDISFLVNPRDRIGLTGKNGAGKSTLLKVLCGKHPYDSGSVSVPKDTTIGYLPQHMTVSDTKSVFNETLTAFTELLFIEKEIHRLNVEISHRTDYETNEYLQLINQLSDRTDRYNLLGGGSKEANIENTLIGLGFERSDFDRPTAEFSGGWRMRIELAKVLLQKPDVLLLDEPTNHLDIESVQWFEEMLKVYEGAVIVVSHDKAFLDNLTNRTIEISLGRIYDYKVPYSKYLEQRQELFEQQKAAYENQRKMIETTEDFIERFRYKATKSVQVQSRIKQLEKIERIEIDEFDKSSIHFRFPPAPHCGQVILETKELSKRFGNHLVLDKIDFVLEKGQKVAFVGRNGEGKTTMSKIIIGTHQYEGFYKLGHNISIGYYAQNQSEMLNDNHTVFETIDHVATGDIRTKIRDILASFLFRGEDIDKKVAVLSGGERARLSLAKLLLQPSNLLILDEPTNHLDMRSKEILKQALIKFDGTVLLVSHDRDFLNGIVDVVYEFRNKKMRQHLGGITEFLQRKKLESLNQLNQFKKQQAEQVSERTSSENKMKYEERKEFDKQLRKIQRLVEESEGRIAAFEEKVNEYDLKMADPNNLTDHSIFEKYNRLKHDLEIEMKNWETYSNELDAMKALKSKM